MVKTISVTTKTFNRIKAVKDKEDKSWSELLNYLLNLFEDNDTDNNEDDEDDDDDEEEEEKPQSLLSPFSTHLPSLSRF